MGGGGGVEGEGGKHQRKFEHCFIGEKNILQMNSGE